MNRDQAERMKNATPCARDSLHAQRVRRAHDTPATRKERTVSMVLVPSGDAGAYDVGEEEAFPRRGGGRVRGRNGGRKGARCYQ